jgi:hypothetical protein
MEDYACLCINAGGSDDLISAESDGWRGRWARPEAAQVHRRWMPSTCGVHRRSIRVGGLLPRWLGGDAVGGRLLAVGVPGPGAGG